MARKFWQKKTTTMLIAIIFLWYNHKHEVNKQVRSSAAGMIDMSDGREKEALFVPAAIPRLRTGAIRHVWHMRNSATCVARAGLPVSGMFRFSFHSLSTGIPGRILIPILYLVTERQRV